MQMNFKNILIGVAVGVVAVLVIYRLNGGGCLVGCAIKHVTQVVETRPMPTSDSLEAAKSKFKAAESLYLKARNNDKSARDALKAKSEAGNYAAKMYLAFFYKFASHEKSDKEHVDALFVDIKELIQKWAGEGIPEAQNALGLMHEHELGGTPKNPKEAFRLFKLAADQGHMLGQSDVACAYYKGVGVEKNFEEAFKYYKLAADQGCSLSQANIGLMYEDGIGVKKDLKEAVRFYKLSADQNHAWGQNHLGRMYRDGLGGLPQDDKEAVQLFTLAVEQGNAMAQRNLGKMYEEGRGGLPKDAKEAVKLYKLSADQDDYEGEIYLGEAYEKGLGGLPKDKAEAIKLYQLAVKADRGAVRKIAEDNLKRLGISDSPRKTEKK